jgi:hypothetical protein
MLLQISVALLLAGAPSDSQTQTAQAPAKAEEKKICRKQIETGSLIKGKKICYTSKQWQKLSDDARDEVERTASMGSRSGQ